MELLNLGYSMEDISCMKPIEAHYIIQESKDLNK